MNNRAWQFKQREFDPAILQRLEHLNLNDLNDPNQRQLWIEFGKKFSEMQLTPEIVQSMNYQTFAALKAIMAHSLAELSRRTEHQREKISKQQEAYAKLQQEEDKLNQIHQDNERKGDLIKAKLEALQKKEEEDDSLFDDVDIDDTPDI